MARVPRPRSPWASAAAIGSLPAVLLALVAVGAPGGGALVPDVVPRAGDDLRASVDRGAPEAVGAALRADAPPRTPSVDDLDVTARGRGAASSEASSARRGRSVAAPDARAPAADVAGATVSSPGSSGATAPGGGGQPAPAAPASSPGPAAGTGSGGGGGTSSSSPSPSPSSSRSPGTLGDALRESTAATGATVAGLGSGVREATAGTVVAPVGDVAGGATDAVGGVVSGAGAGLGGVLSGGRP